MYVKPPYQNLNSGLHSPHPTSTYTCRVTIASRVCDGDCHIFRVFGQLVFVIKKKGLNLTLKKKNFLLHWLI